jgi:ABC-type enterochelin transport system permease subunit
MSPAARRWIFWTPRVLTILFAAFISIFALDVFGEHYSPGQLLIALGMHLIPTALIVVALLIAWRWAWVGAVLFFGLGVLYIVTMHGRARWDWYLLIAGPLFLVGLLFLLNWRYRAELRGRG